MVFFNYATMQMAAKIVYYGPGLCGKTTNLHHIYTKTSPQSRGEMVSLETETDRTLFFDLLPIDGGVIGGFKTRLQLYTIPGQVFYNTTRKLVLKGVDGIVFVADSQQAMLDANVESLKNLRENLAEIGLDLDDIPLVLQLNKRDLPNVANAEQITAALDPNGRYESVEASAVTGMGVFETLKLISKLTLRTLRRRMTGEEPVKPGPRNVATFRVKDEGGHGSRTVAGTTATPAVGTSFSPPTFTTPAAAASISPGAAAATAVRPLEEEIEAIPVGDEIFAGSSLADTADIDAHILAGAPVAEPPAAEPIEEVAEAIEPEPEPEALPLEAELAGAPFEEVQPEPVAELAPPPEPEVNFGQTEKAAKPADVKHVKVRSSVDIMAELEALRKRATTQSTPKPKKEAPPPIEIEVPRPLRELRRSMGLSIAPGVLPRTRSIRVAVSLEGEDGVLQTQEQTLE